MGNYIQKVTKVYVEAKVDKRKEKQVPYDIKVMDLYSKAINDNELYKYDKNSYLCAYKTKNNDEQYIIILFTLILPGNINGNNESSKTIMELFSFMEKHFTPLHDTHVDKNISTNGENTYFLKFVKKIDENDYL